MGPKPILDLGPRASAAGIVMGFGPGGQDLGPVVADPAEVVPRKHGKTPVRPAEEIGMIAGFGQDLDQSPGMTEGIEIGRRLDVHAEGFPEITFADENLADERFARGMLQSGWTNQPPSTAQRLRRTRVRMRRKRAGSYSSINS